MKTLNKIIRVGIWFIATVFSLVVIPLFGIALIIYGVANIDKLFED